MKILKWLARLARIRIYFNFEPEEELRPMVYISSPYTIGDPTANVRRQVNVAHALMDVGMAPLAPLPGSHILNEIRWRPYEDWMEVDLSHVARCDAVLRLKGESSGADREVAFAESLGIPVFFVETDEVPPELIEYFS